MTAAHLSDLGWDDESCDSLIRRGADEVCCAPYSRPGRLGPEWLRRAAEVDCSRLRETRDDRLRFALQRVALARDTFERVLHVDEDGERRARHGWARAVRDALKLCGGAVRAGGAR